jgi:hypothetical protein
LILENSWLDMGMCVPFCMAICIIMPLKVNMTSDRVLSFAKGHVRSSNSPWTVCHGVVEKAESNAISTMPRERAVSKVGFFG